MKCTNAYPGNASGHSKGCNYYMHIPDAEVVLPLTGAEVLRMSVPRTNRIQKLMDSTEEQGHVWS